MKPVIYDHIFLHGWFLTDINCDDRPATRKFGIQSQVVPVTNDLTLEKPCFCRFFVHKINFE